MVTTFVTTYIGSKLTWNLRGKEKRRDREKKRTNRRIKKRKVSKIYLEDKLIVSECFCIWISGQEHNEMFQCISSQIPILIKSFALVKDMSPQLNWISGAWTRKVQAGKES